MFAEGQGSVTVLAPPGAPCRPGSASPLALVPVDCCLCRDDQTEPVAVGEDFEHRTSPDTFLAVRCRQCSLVYLNPRPAASELDRIFPSDEDAFPFKARRSVETRRLLESCRGLPPDASILDVGCGNGFHLGLLRESGEAGWKLEGIDSSARAVEAARRQGLQIHHGPVQHADLPKDRYDLAFLIAVVEHVDDPPGVVEAVRSLLKPGGKLVIVTPNADSLDSRLFRTRHWGGYHFPRRWNLFSSGTIRLLASKARMTVEEVTTLVTPAHWITSIRNRLMDRNASRWLVEQFNLRAISARAFFTLVDLLVGQGGLLRATFRRTV